MNPFKILCTSIFQLVSLFCVIIYLLGVLNTYFSDRNDYCMMTFMFEYPQFVRITLPKYDEAYPQYALYAYGEGRMTERARKMWFDGIPVLYLPGNSGSHMQSRSLASVALRKALSDEYDYHFDYFTVSYNEDLSGIYGGVLEKETEYAAACITEILSLYKYNKYTNTVPTSVILIGHSMGGVIAKRLLAYQKTINITNTAITLASPLDVPLMNTDILMNNYYKLIEKEWQENINSKPEVKDKKMLLSFGNGARDILMPAGLTSSDDSDVNALTTSIPGVWVSPDHVSIVWCKQLVMAVNRFLFSIVHPHTQQVLEDKKVLLTKARQFFEANRSMTLSPDIVRANMTMIPEAFWYEDNRRIYQISRPEITKTIYLMIRLVKFPQNRFVAIESVNVDDRDWLFGCSAQYTYGTHRYCKQATSLTELSRRSGAATDFGKRKLATVHLHDIAEKEPSWTHVLVKVSPTRKPIVLNVDINDLASRQVMVDLPSGLSYGRIIVKHETWPESVYYELILPGFDKIYQAYWLYVEPAQGCQAKEYHVTAELHVPWAKGHEYFHYFTQTKRSPMKLRLFKSNPNATTGEEAAEHVRVTLLLDPQCTFTISISPSWYHTLAQLARNYTPVLIPYMAAIVLLAASYNIDHLRRRDRCVSMHIALMSERVKPYYPLVFSRALVAVVASVPPLSYLVEQYSSANLEISYLTRSLLVLPAYMTALGLVNILAAAVVLVMLFSSQLACRMFSRIIWRGGPTVAEHAVEGMRRIPMAVTILITLSVPWSCGAASMAAGAVYYAFLISKMYEDYLEDYVYKLMAKVAARFCRLLKSEKSTAQSQNTEKKEKLDELTNSQEFLPIEANKDSGDIENTIAKRTESKSKCDLNAGDSTSVGKDATNVIESVESKALVPTSEAENKELVGLKEDTPGAPKREPSDEFDDEDDLHFHMMMFFLWMVVTLVNVPVLLTWARNFKYNKVLMPDTSYYTGLVMSGCTATIWQMKGPQLRLKHYELLSNLTFAMAILILAFGPQSLVIVNYGVTLIFAFITQQQLADRSDGIAEADSTQENRNTDSAEQNSSNSEKNASNSEQTDSSSEQNASSSKDNNPSESENVSSEEKENNAGDKGEQSQNDNVTSRDNSECECNENRIYGMFKNLREKFSFSEDL